MENQRFRHRSDQEWFDLITECRQSGLSDSQWCQLNGIARSSFSLAAKRLQQKSFALPDPHINREPLDAIPPQEVVPVTISPEGEEEKNSEMSLAQAKDIVPMYLDNSHTIEIKTSNLSIRINNDADPGLLCLILKTIGGGLC